MRLTVAVLGTELLTIEFAARPDPEAESTGAADTERLPFGFEPPHAEVTAAEP